MRTPCVLGLLLGCVLLAGFTAEGFRVGHAVVHPKSGTEYTILKPYRGAFTEVEESAGSPSRQPIFDAFGKEYKTERVVGKGGDGVAWLASYEDPKTGRYSHAIVKVMKCGRGDLMPCDLIQHISRKEYEALVMLDRYSPYDRRSWPSKDDYGIVAKIVNSDSKNRIVSFLDPPFCVNLERHGDGPIVQSAAEDGCTAVVEIVEMVGHKISTPEVSMTLLEGMAMYYDDNSEMWKSRTKLPGPFKLLTIGRVLLQVVYQVLQGVAFLSSANLLHRDLKSSNIVVRACSEPGACHWATSMEIKVIDFFNMVNCQDTSSKCGKCTYKPMSGYEDVNIFAIYTPNYAPPETYLMSNAGVSSAHPDVTRENMNTYCESGFYPPTAIDSFSLGTILLSMLNFGVRYGFWPDKLPEHMRTAGIISSIKALVSSQGTIDAATSCLKNGKDIVHVSAKGLKEMDTELLAMLAQNQNFKHSIGGLEYSWRRQISVLLDAPEDGSTDDESAREWVRAHSTVKDTVKANQLLIEIIGRLLKCDPQDRITPLQAFIDFNAEFVSAVLETEIYWPEKRKAYAGAVPIFRGNTVAAGSDCGRTSYTGCVFMPAISAKQEFDQISFYITCEDNGQICRLANYGRATYLMVTKAMGKDDNISEVTAYFVEPYLTESPEGPVLVVLDHESTISVCFTKDECASGQAKNQFLFKYHMLN